MQAFSVTTGTHNISLWNDQTLTFTVARAFFPPPKKNLKPELRAGVNSHKALAKFIAKASDFQSRQDMEYWINSYIPWAFNIIANIQGNQPMQTNGFFWHWAFSWVLRSHFSSKKIDYDHSLSSLTLLFKVLVNCARLVTTALLWDHRYKM